MEDKEKTSEEQAKAKLQEVVEFLKSNEIEIDATGMLVLIGLMELTAAIDRNTMVKQLEVGLHIKQTENQSGLMGAISNLMKGMGQDFDQGEEWKKGYQEDEDDEE